MHPRRMASKKRTDHNSQPAGAMHISDLCVCVCVWVCVCVCVGGWVRFGEVRKSVKRGLI